jgi:hypothetical protein
LLARGPARVVFCSRAAPRASTKARFQHSRYAPNKRSKKRVEMFPSM